MPVGALRQGSRPAGGAAGVESVAEERVVELRLDAGRVVVGAGRAVALPDDDEVPVVVGGDRRKLLGACRKRVDMEFVRASQTEAPRHDASTRVRGARQIAVPGHDIAHRRECSHGRGELASGRIAVDLEFIAQSALEVEPLALDAGGEVVRILGAVALPDDHAIAGKT